MAKRTKGRAEVEKRANALQELVVEYVSIDTLQPNSYNPNRQSEHDFELLKKSMSEDGFTQPIVVQEETLTIVDGEHRWRAGRDLGYTEVPIVKVTMTPEQMRIATLRHNRARGSEDIELSAAVLRDLEQLGALDWAQDSLMLDDAEIQKLLEDVSAPEALAAADYAEAWEPSDQVDPMDRAAGMYGDSSMTPAAADALREREKQIAEAKTEEERVAIRKDRALYRVSLVYAQEEAAIVKKVLEPAPAARLLELCQQVAASEK